MDAPGIASQFKTGSVYIADGLPPTTGSNVSSLLTSTDGIKVAVLQEGQPTESLAKQVLATQPDGTVVIVVSGDEVAAAANAMPSGDLSDLLARAENVSTNGLDTVRTLVTNVHTWQEAHPQTVTATQQAHDPMLLVPAGIISGPVVIAVVASVVLFRRRSRRLSPSVKGTGPRDIRPLVGRLMEQRLKIQQPSMRQSIEELCTHVEAYFKRVKNDEMAREALRSQLQDALEVTQVFADIEQNRLYYRKPKESMVEGRQAIDGLADSVLESVRSANARNLVHYSVSTKILDAQRYR